VESCPMTAQLIRIDDDAVIHRIGGGSVENLVLKPAEQTLIPPGISTLHGGSPDEAADAMRRRFPRMAPKGKTIVGTTTAGQIRQAGFDIMRDPTPRFPHHARLLHPEGADGFNRENLDRLALTFENRAGL
jgi:hypothetical protein